jgi:HK97 family phage prohead protease
LAANRDVLALINHDDALGILGRTSDGSLCLVEDDRGLSFTLELADDRQGHIVHRALSLGLVKGMSFRFTPGTMIKGRDQCFHTSVEKFAEISFIIGKDKLPAHRSGCSELAIPLSVLRRRLDLLELDAL